MAESGTHEDVTLEAYYVHGKVPLESEDDDELNGPAELTPRDTRPPPASTRDKRHKKRAKRTADQAQLNSNSGKKPVTLQSANQVSQSVKNPEFQKKQDWWQPPWQSQQKWQSQQQWQPQQQWHKPQQSQKHTWKYSSQPKHSKQPQHHSAASSFQRMNLPPPPKPFSRQAPLTEPVPVPSMQSSNPFSQSVSSQPSQPSIPANLPPGTVVCILPK